MLTLLNNTAWLTPSLLLVAGALIVLLLIATYQRRQIRRLRRQLKDSQQVTQRFSDLLSHELRNPMNAIDGHLHLLEADAGDHRGMRHHLDRIRTASRTLMDQLDDILSVAVGFRDDDEPGLIETFPIVSLCRDVVDEFSITPHPTGSQAGIELIFDEQLPNSLIGPRKAIRIALRHLVSNAIRYGHGKAISIEVSYRGSAPGVMDGMLAIRVRDQGVGLTKDMSRSLFRLFSHLRAHDHVEASNQSAPHQSLSRGIGRGLPISKQVIERYGGRIGFLSRPNHGSVFWLRVPVKASTDAGRMKTEAVEKKAARNTQTAAPIQQHNMRVVIIDDLPSRADIFAEYLSLLLPNDCNIIDCKSTETFKDSDLPTAFYLVASDSFITLSQEHQQKLMAQPMLILDYGHGDTDKLPEARLVGPYDPDLLSRLDEMAEDHPLRRLMAKATG